jgi:hypothetical protein
MVKYRIFDHELFWPWVLYGFLQFESIFPKSKVFIIFPDLLCRDTKQFWNNTPGYWNIFKNCGKHQPRKIWDTVFARKFAEISHGLAAKRLKLKKRHILIICISPRTWDQDPDTDVQGAFDLGHGEAAGPLSELITAPEASSSQLPALNSCEQADILDLLARLNSKEKRQLFSQILGGARGKGQQPVLSGGGQQGKRQLFSQILGGSGGRGNMQQSAADADGGGGARGKRQLFSQILSQRQARRNGEANNSGLLGHRYKRFSAPNQAKGNLSRLFSQILRKKLEARLAGSQSD